MKFLFKLVTFSKSYARKHKWVFFSEHGVNVQTCNNRLIAPMQKNNVKLWLRLSEGCSLSFNAKNILLHVLRFISTYWPKIVTNVSAHALDANESIILICFKTCHILQLNDLSPYLIMQSLIFYCLWLDPCAEKLQ